MEGSSGPGLCSDLLTCPQSQTDLKLEVKVKVVSRVRLCVTPGTMQCIEFSRPESWSGQPLPSPGDPPNPGIEPRSPTLRADSLPAGAPGKPKNPGVGSLSLLQGSFLTQESNQALLHCGWILYQMSYLDSLFFKMECQEFPSG